jgi:hypothetical protein
LGSACVRTRSVPGVPALQVADVRSETTSSSSMSAEREVRLVVCGSEIQPKAAGLSLTLIGARLRLAVTGSLLPTVAQPRGKHV